MKYITLVAFFFALAGCHKQIEQSKAVTPVKVAAVDMYQPKGGVRYSASILPGRQVSLAFRVSGLVSGIYRVGGRGLEPGDTVPAGAVLAQLRQEDYNHSSAQSQGTLEGLRQSHRSAIAQLAQARASKARADADFARSQTLIDTKSITRPEYDATRAQRDVTAAQVDAAIAQVDVAAAQVRAAEASLATTKLALHDTALTAPFSGAVVQRNVEVGMLAGPSATAYTLADISTVKAAFGVPDTVMVQMRTGRSIPISVEALPGHEFQGTISSIAAVADSETRLFQVEISIPNRGLALKPGMIASLSLEDARPAPAVPVIPLSAVVRDQAHPADFAVMVVEGKIAKSRRVALGPTFGELLVVTSGLKPGELVIRAGGSMVNDGEAVEVIR